MESNSRITHPSYYNDKKITPIEYIHANKLGFDEGNVVKYITRHDGKNGAADVIKTMVYECFILQDKYQFDREQFSMLLDDLRAKFVK